MFSFKYEIRMVLIADNFHLIFLTDLTHSGQFFPGPYSGYRIVRITQEE